MSDEFLMAKEGYVLNSLSLGLAVQYLSGATGKFMNHWLLKIAKEASSQYDQLTPEQIEKTIQDYLDNQTTGNNSITKFGHDKS